MTFSSLKLRIKCIAGLSVVSSYHPTDHTPPYIHMCMIYDIMQSQQYVKYLSRIISYFLSLDIIITLVHWNLGFKGKIKFQFKCVGLLVLASIQISENSKIAFEEKHQYGSHPSSDFSQKCQEHLKMLSIS